MSRVDTLLWRHRVRAIFGPAFLGGMLGAMALSGLMRLGLWMEGSVWGLEMLLGTWLNGGHPNEQAWFLGFFWHVLNGGLFSIPYGIYFLMSRKAGPLRGAAIGVLHAFLAAALINVMLFFNPLTLGGIYPEAYAVPFGLGAVPLIQSLILHVVYGALVGWITRYAMASALVRFRREIPRKRKKRAPVIRSIFERKRPAPFRKTG